VSAINEVRTPASLSPSTGSLHFSEGSFKALSNAVALQANTAATAQETSAVVNSVPAAPGAKGDTLHVGAIAFNIICYRLTNATS
jgi:hypothetical protein